MKTTLIALLVGTFFAGTASAADTKACYSYIDYESANNSQAMCLGSIEQNDKLAAKTAVIVVAEAEQEQPTPDVNEYAAAV
ncbi:MAG: hypothetical protein HXY26_02960 [Hydrogenophilaceae bacterium]|nr:hypothetical protein [Hydrogenophilaceae bacterium]